MTDDSLDRYARLRSILPMEVVASAFAIVGGAGALGNEAAKNLALIGVGHVLVCDFDRIEIHNLTRSILFRREDAGRLKAEVAAERMREINPDVHAFGFPRNIAELGLGFYRRAQVILTTFDSPHPRYVVNEACMLTGRRWVDAGLSAQCVGRGVVVVYDAASPDAPCYGCPRSPDRVAQDLEQLRGHGGCQAVDLRISQQGGVPSSPMTSSVIAGTQITAALDLLRERSEEDPASAWIDGGFEIDLDARSSCVRRGRRVPGCYFHDRLALRPMRNVVEMPSWVSSVTTVAEVLEQARKDLGAEQVRIEFWERIQAEGTCSSCGAPWNLFVPVSTYRLTRQELKCPICSKGSFVASLGSGLLTELGEDFPHLDWTLAAAGTRPLDVIRVVSSDADGIPIGAVFYEITGDAAQFGLPATLPRG